MLLYFDILDEIFLMEISVLAHEAAPSRPDARSLAKTAYGIWRRLYRALPELGYTTEALVEIDKSLVRVRGHPTFYEQLERFVLDPSQIPTAAPLPDCPSTRRFARAMFWFANETRIVEPRMRLDTGTYLWTFDQKRYEQARALVAKGFCTYSPYLLAHLARALQQNL